MIHIGLLVGFTISINACIDRIREHMMNGGIGRGDPLNLGAGIGLGGKRKTLRTKPEPDLTDRSHFGELFKDTVNDMGDGLVGMEEDLAVLFAPEKADREAPS